MATLKQIRVRYRYPIILLIQLVKTDFKLRYQGSALGYLWTLLRPLLMFVILYVVFSVFLPVGKGFPHYPVYLLLGIVLWNYFTEVTTGSVDAIVDKGELIRKINFPKYVIILAGSLSALINLGFNFIIVGIFMFAQHIALTWQAIFVIPLIGELFVFALAVAFLLSALYVKFRDMNYIWDVIMQAAFYATPIIYILGKLYQDHPAIAKVLILNPVAQIIQDARYLLITKDTATIAQLFPTQHWVWAIPIGFVVTLALIASSYFKRRSKYFAEEV